MAEHTCQCLITHVDAVWAAAHQLTLFWPAEKAEELMAEQNITWQQAAEVLAQDMAAMNASMKAGSSREKVKDLTLAGYISQKLVSRRPTHPAAHAAANEAGLAEVVQQQGQGPDAGGAQQPEAGQPTTCTPSSARLATT